MTFTSKWQSDKWFLCLLIHHFSAQSIAAFDLRLKKKAFVVFRQDVLSHKSIVWSCSSQAQQMGIKFNNPIMEVKKKYKNLTVVKRNSVFETNILKDLKHILYKLTPDFQIKGNGVLLIDLSHLLLNNNICMEDLALKLKEEIKYKTNLSHLSFGMSASKITAWIMAGLIIPDGIRICNPKEELSSLRFLDCHFLPGLSWRARKKLKKYGVKKIGQLQQLKKSELVRRFGKEGEKIYGMVRGVDFSNKEEGPAPLFVETLFKKDIINQQIIYQLISHTADKFSYQLKLKKLLTNKLTFLLRYTDNRTNQKTAALPFATNDFFLILKVCQELFKDVYLRRVSIKSIRLITKKPLPDFGLVKLIETKREKKQRLLQRGITHIRKRFFFDAIFQAGQLGSLKVGKKSTKSAILPKKTITKGLKEPQFLSAELADKGIFIGISKKIKIPGKNTMVNFQGNHSFTFKEIGFTLYGESIRSDFQKINSLINKKTRCTVLVNHKILQPKSQDITTGKKLIKQQMSAVSPLFTQGRFYSFLIRIPQTIIRSIAVLNYLLEIASIPVKNHFDVHLEFSHGSWFTEYILDTLKKKGIGICNTTHQTTFATTNKGYIRYLDGIKNSPAFLISLYDNKDFIPRQISLRKKVDQLAIVYQGNSIHQALQNIQLLNKQFNREK